MGVYIKGMGMPTDDMKNIMILVDGRVFQYSGYGNPEILGTAVPVPPHGRCVDADKLMQEMRLFIKENMLSRDDARELLETIKDAPTIIPAEEGET